MATRLRSHSVSVTDGGGTGCGEDGGAADDAVDDAAGDTGEEGTGMVTAR